MDDDDLARPLKKRLWEFFLWYHAVLLGSLLLLLAAYGILRGFAHAAPAPVYRRPPPLDKRIEGGWVLVWGGSEGTCYLSPQGFWGATMGGSQWHGDWSLDDKTLTIREARLDRPDAPVVTYVIELDGEVQPRGGAAGVIKGGTTFVLRMEGRPGR